MNNITQEQHNSKQKSQIAYDFWISLGFEEIASNHPNHALLWNGATYVEIESPEETPEPVQLTLWEQFLNLI